MIFQTLRTLIASSLILQFDGSLRIPVDPNNDIIPASYSSELASLATCSFAILEDDGESIAFGSKRIPCSSQTTSADVEYEGMILGLVGLIDTLEHHINKSLFSGQVTVRGDCKTIIDQMNGVSLPRKQKSYYNQAKLVVQQLTKSFDLNLHFEHITREHNELCDSMCKVMMHRFQEHMVSKFLASVNNLKQNFVEIPLPENKRKLLKFEETVFAPVLNQISKWNGYLPISLRPRLLCEIYFASHEVGDYVAMRLIGVAMRNESKRWRKIRIHNNISARISRDLDLMGLRLTYISLIRLNLKREAEKVENSLTLSYNQTGCTRYEDLYDFQDRMPVLKIGFHDAQHGKLKEWHDEMLSNFDNPTPTHTITFSKKIDPS